VVGGVSSMRNPAMRMLAAIMLPLSAHAIALFTKFREPDRALRSEWLHFVRRHSHEWPPLANNAIVHHHAVRQFCRSRRRGCSWAQYHALVDSSRAPHAHLFDQSRLPAGELKREAKVCARLHKPTAAQLYEQVARSEPAVLTGLMEGWPALHRWTDDYLVQVVGDRPVGVSITEGAFDTPEDPQRWGFPGQHGTSRAHGGTLRVVARPAHTTLPLESALREMRRFNESGLAYYVEYLPVEALRHPAIHEDLSDSGAVRLNSEGSSEVPASPPPSTPLPNFGDGTAEGAPTLREEGEPGELAIATWLMPKKHLLWLGPGGTIGATHYDPYENLMQVVRGSKIFFVANPDDGRKLGGFTPMQEGHLKLRGSAPEVELYRSVDGLEPKPTELHHYAAASLSVPAEAQPQLPQLRDVVVFNCTAHAGEVVYIPSYWWHEVVSLKDRVSGASPLGINWFYEAFYQRVFPNATWDLSLHYLELNTTLPFNDPFPPLPMDIAGAHATDVAHTPSLRGRGQRRFSDRLAHAQAEQAAKGKATNKNEL